MSNLNVFLLVVLLSGSLFAGCKEDLYDPDKPGSDDQTVFDFSMVSSYTLDVKYDVPEGYNVYFEVYGENPLMQDENGQVVRKNIEAIDKGYTDGNGAYKCRILVPSVVQKLYIYSPYAGVPQMMEAVINNGVLSPAVLPEVETSMLTRAAGDYRDEPYNMIVGNKLKRLGYWKNSAETYSLNGKKYSLSGRPDYVLSEKLSVAASVYNLINQVVPEGGRVDPKYMKNGDIHITEDAHVDLYLLSEGTSANSTLAYYCYETGKRPSSEAEIAANIVVAYPNAKVLQYHGYYPQGYNGAMERGEGIRLHYWKNGVNVSDTFPKNTSIGWVIYNNSYKDAVSNRSGVNTGMAHFFSDAALNRNKENHVALFRMDDFVIFGFEDWDPVGDCNDVVFHVVSDPIDAITSEVPDVKPEEPNDTVVSASVLYKGILAFEDLWPSQGDFDMNDVVVKYESVVDYNKKNEIVKTTDNFTLLWSGATIRNGFAYQLDVKKGDVDIDLSGAKGAYIDQSLEKATIRLFDDALTANGGNMREVKYTVVANYSKRRPSKNDFTLPPYNSFITTTSVQKEVHLTNYRPTNKADLGFLGMGDDRSVPEMNYYYITYNSDGIQMPFAINVPGDSFVIPKEGVQVNKRYPGFINWVRTLGKENADWYLHPAN